jgi:hypothetical protein
LPIAKAPPQSLDLGSSGGGNSSGGRDGSRDSGSSNRSGGGSSRVGRLGSILLLSAGSGALALGGIGLLVGLVGAVDGHLDGDLTSLNLLSVHLVDSLLLQLLGSQGNESETSALAGLTAGLKLLNHESGDGSESNLGRRGLVDLEELQKLLLGQVVGQVGNHDLGLGGNAISRGATLTALTLSALGLGSLSGSGSIGVDSSGGGSLGSGGIKGLALLLLVGLASAATTGTTTSTASTATAATTSGSAAAGTFRARTLAVGTLDGLLASGLGLASELNRDLALKDLLAGKLLDGTLSLSGGREVDKGVANRAVGARVLGDRNGLTRGRAVSK